jgi:hypothetical protein
VWRFKVKKMLTLVVGLCFIGSVNPIGVVAGVRRYCFLDSHPQCSVSQYNPQLYLLSLYIYIKDRKIMLMSPAGLRPEKALAGNAQQQLKTPDPTSRQRESPHKETRNCLKVFKERTRKIGRGSQMVA